MYYYLMLQLRKLKHKEVKYFAYDTYDVLNSSWHVVSIYCIRFFFEMSGYYEVSKCITFLSN